MGPFECIELYSLWNEGQTTSGMHMKRDTVKRHRDPEERPSTESCLAAAAMPCQDVINAMVEIRVK